MDSQIIRADTPNHLARLGESGQVPPCHRAGLYHDAPLVLEPILGLHAKGADDLGRSNKVKEIVMFQLVESFKMITRCLTIGALSDVLCSLRRRVETSEGNSAYDTTQ